MTNIENEMGLSAGIRTTDLPSAETSASQKHHWVAVYVDLYSYQYVRLVVRGIRVVISVINIMIWSINCTVALQ